MNDNFIIKTNIEKLKQNMLDFRKKKLNLYNCFT